MINLLARDQIGRVVEPLARRLARAGVSPNVVTVVGTAGVCAGALAFFPRGKFLVGTLVVTAFVFSDTLDGAIARQRGSSGVWGAFLDSTLDRFADAAVFGSLVVWYGGGGHSRLLAGVALFDLVAGSITSYAKARAESLGLTANVGIAERAERLILVLVAAFFCGCGLPVVLPLALWVLAAATAVTVGQRLVEVHRQARIATAAAGTAVPPSPARAR